MNEFDLKFDKAKEHFLSALELLAAGHLIEAEAELKRSLQFIPNRLSTLTNLCAVLIKRRQFDEANRYLDIAERLGAISPQLLLNKGLILFERNLCEEALSTYDRCIELQSNYSEAWNNRGITLNSLKRYSEALASYDKCIELDPGYAEAWNNRGITLNSLKRYSEALASYDKCIELDPGYAEAWSNRGNVLNELTLYGESLASYDRAIQLRPDFAKAWINRGVTLLDLMQFKEAMSSYDRSIELQPNNAEALYNRSLLWLSQKNFADGFRDFHWRWNTEEFSSPYLETSLLLCDSISPSGKILLWAEQGLGDEVFYSALLPNIIYRFASIGLIADPRLHTIFERSFPEIKLFSRTRLQARSFHSQFDSHLPIGDIGSLLKVDSRQLAVSRRPFLMPNLERTARFRGAEPFTGGKITCGLAWRSANREFGYDKSLTLRSLYSVITLPGVEFINLQYGDVKPEIQSVQNDLNIKIHQIKDLDIFNDIDGLLALISACDVIITTSNVTAHLAGSIGKSGGVFVPFSTGRIWYWHYGDDLSFWYPSLKMFYQSSRHSWSETVDQAAEWLQNIIKTQNIAH